MKVLFSEQEIQVLRSGRLSNEARALYMLEIRPFMNYRTGIVGESRRVSLQQFREGVEVLRPRGSTKADYRPTVPDVRWMLRELRQAGLIEPLPKERKTDPIRLRLPMAIQGEQDKSVQNEQQQRNSKGATAKGNADRSMRLEVINGKGTAKEEQHTSDSLVYSVTNVTGADAPEAPASRLWRLWVELVGDTQPNRAFLAKLIRDHGESAVVDAVAAAYAKGPVEPRSFVRGCLRPKRRRFQA